MLKLADSTRQLDCNVVLFAKYKIGWEMIK